METNLILPQVKGIEIFIDDTGDKAIGIQGFTMLACDDYAAGAIRLGLKECLHEHGLDSLHLSRLCRSGGKLRRLLKAYLAIIRKEISRSNFGYFRCMISPQELVQETSNKFMTLASSILEKTRGVPVPDSIKQLAAYVGVPAIEMIAGMKFSHRLPCSITIENKGGAASAAREKILVGIGFSEFRSHLAKLLKVYLKLAYRLNCTIKDISIVKSEHPMIGAVDALGNLNLNYVRGILWEESGKPITPTMKIKYDVFVDLLREINSDPSLTRQRIKSAFSIVKNRVLPIKAMKRISVFEIRQANNSVQGE